MKGDILNSVEPIGMKNDSSRHMHFILLGALFFSGANGLVMEIVFRRQLLLSLGVTHYSVGTVLAVFMAGLALGSFLFGRAADKTAYPIRIYGLLEIGVGLTGLVLLLVLPYLDPVYTKLYQALADEGSPGILLKSLLAGSVLLLPTVFMGGTLPVAAKAMTGKAKASGGPLGLLYGINTLGGVAGVLGSTFWLLEAAGANLTLALVSLTNLLIGIFCFAVLGPKFFVSPEEHASAAVRAKAEMPSSNFSTTDAAVVLVFFISGFAALSLEVIWTRILAYVVGSHGYTFGIILAAFLAGIAIGSMLLSRLADRVVDPVKWLGVSQLAIGMAALAISALMFNLRGLTNWLALHAGNSWNRFITMEMLVLFLLLLIPTLCMGAVFPLVMTAIVKNHTKLGTNVGISYALNTVGSILGAVLAGFVLIPAVGIGSGLKITILTSIAAGCLLLLLIPKRIATKAAVLGLGLGLGALVVYARIGYPLQQISMDERLIFYDESSSSTVAVREDADGSRMLSINGLDEVPVDPASLLTFRVLAHLPLLVHPAPQQVMVLSLGGAITTGSVARHPVAQIDAVELCPPVVRAAAFFAQWNHGVMADERLHLILQDGRNHLLTTPKKYDVITADATHPWSADSWILYTREMYQLIGSRLKESGIFCQWIPLHWMSADDFKCILRTMRSAFAHLSLWYTGSYVVAMGYSQPPRTDPSAIERRMQSADIQKDLAAVGINSAASLLGLHLISDADIDRFAGKGPLNSDDFAYLEHAAARCFGRETTPENLAALRQARKLPEFLPADTSAESMPGFQQNLRRIFRARDKTITGRLATYQGNFTQSVADYRAALVQAPEDGVTKILLDDALGTLASTWAHMGDQARRAGKFREAVAIYSRALKFDDNAPRAHNGLGLVYFRQGDYRSALRHFDTAVEQYPKQAQIRFNRTLALLKLKRLEEARHEIAVINLLEAGGANIYSAQLQKIMSQLPDLTR
jgi:spermidine synthase